MIPLPGYKGRYSATEGGLIYSHLSERTLKGRPLPTGYLRVNLSDADGNLTDSLVHRLVCEAFHGESELDVNHKDCDKANNKPENLEWVTKSENMVHAFRSGRLSPQRTATAARNRVQFSVPVQAISLSDGSVKRYASMSDAGRDGFSHSKVSLCVAGARKSHAGHRWELLKEALNDRP